VPSLLPRRRALVTLAWAAGLTAGGAGGALSLTGCTSGSNGPAPSGSATPDADDRARLAAARIELVLAAQASALAGRPGTSRALAAAAGVATAAHTAHVAALLEGVARQLTAAASTSSRSSASSASSPSSASSAPTGPAGSTGAPVTAAGLVRAEDAAVAAHQGALGPVSGPLARLVASVAASDAALAAVLRGAGG
jgi:hypothetical protein